MSTARTTDDAFQDVLLALFRLHGQVLHAADVMSADAGLSGARWQGLAEVLPNVDHARAGLIGLTAAGRRTLEALQQRQRVWLDRCLRGVTRTGLDAVAASLAGLADRVEHATTREQATPVEGGPDGPRRAAPGTRRRLTAA